MSSLIRPVAVFGVITLAIGFAAATAFLASARDSSPSGSDICTTTGSEVSDEAPFLAENESAMNKMMSDMAVKPTGDVDVDFVAMMVPHHQGAIEMAIAVLRYGRNPQIRRLAQEIIVTRSASRCHQLCPRRTRCRPPDRTMRNPTVPLISEGVVT